MPKFAGWVAPVEKAWVAFAEELSQPFDFY
jgi:hypothetical protein